MAVYDNQLPELKDLLPTAKNILIPLPVGADTDKLAAGLSLFLLFNQQGKEVSIVCEDSMTVGQSHLFGIDHVSNKFPQTGGGNFVITLEDVVAPNGTVPALQNLDWYPENNNLNLVFHVMPGQTFQPVKVTPHYQGSGLNLIFVIGAANLNSLGGLYSQNQNAFTGVHIVNVDNQGNTGFGATNVVDTNAPCLSEMIASIAPSLGLVIDADMATNLLAGIFASTSNLTSVKVSADTYLIVANLLKLGGKKPEVGTQTTAQVQQGLDLSALIPQQPATRTNIESFTVPTVVSQEPQSQNQPSPEERPFGEGTITETPEPDWLTPKVFKGTSLG